LNIEEHQATIIRARRFLPSIQRG